MIRDGTRDKLIGGRNRSMHRLLKRKNSRRTRRRTNAKRGGGCGCAAGGDKQSGGRVVKPAEFYGGNSGRYFAEGAKELIPEDSAYGKTNAVSFGVTNLGMTETGPNLGPYPNSSGMMTGGAKKRSYRKGRKGTKAKKGKKGKKGASKRC
jgi:hypothetical protein